MPQTLCSPVEQIPDCLLGLRPGRALAKPGLSVALGAWLEQLQLCLTNVLSPDSFVMKAGNEIEQMTARNAL